MAGDTFKGIGRIKAVQKARGKGGKKMSPKEINRVGGLSAQAFKHLLETKGLARDLATKNKQKGIQREQAQETKATLMQRRKAQTTDSHQ